MILCIILVTNGTFAVNYYHNLDDQRTVTDSSDKNTYVNTHSGNSLDDEGHWFYSYPVLASKMFSLRQKRSMLDLASVMSCYNDCSPFNYKDYGCFCGLGGKGLPVDPIDFCCYQHDKCYEHTVCFPPFVYFKSYKFKCFANGMGAVCGKSWSYEQFVWSLLSSQFIRFIWIDLCSTIMRMRS